MIYTESALGKPAHDLYRASLAAGNDLIGARDYPRVAVLLIGDGRDARQKATIASFVRNVSGYRMRAVVQVDDREHELGFAGAIEAGWSELRRRVRMADVQGLALWDYVFHLEEDWEFLRPVDVREMADVLDSDSTVAQVALTREPVNAMEAAAGGVVASWPGEYEELRATTPTGAPGPAYLRHGLFWTTNPSLYRRELVSTRSWPQQERSEDAFTGELRDAGYRFAYLGERSAPEALRHTGERTGLGY